MEKKISDDNLMQYVKDVDLNSSGKINFEEFLRIFEMWKKEFYGLAALFRSLFPINRRIYGIRHLFSGTFDTDTLSAFVALGGCPDKSGQIKADMLRRLCLDLGLTIRVAELLDEIDTDKSGFVDFDEFSQLLKSDEASDDAAIDAVRSFIVGNHS